MPEKEKKSAGYFSSIVDSAKAVLEGMAVTATYYGRKPVTVEYPDRTSQPVTESLPERFRGFLEVDMDICTACKACERDCPINCIEIDVEKIDGIRAMTRFDIDLGKCMYCGICVESCPTSAHAPGDEEETKCIRFTREFEGVTDDFPSLTFRFVRPGDYVVPFKPVKGKLADSRRRGEIAREVRMKARQFNTLAVEWSLAHSAGGPTGVTLAYVTDSKVTLGRAETLGKMVDEAEGDPKKLEDLLYNQALIQTDCGLCDWPTCREYAAAMLEGKDTDFNKCEPGGAQATRDTAIIMHLKAGKTPAQAAKASIALVKASHD